MTNEITWQGHVATTLQLPFFFGANFVEHMFHQCYLVFDLWNGWKNFLLTSRKVRKKNLIPRYHASSLKGTMSKIRNRSIKNLLTQWDIEEENQKTDEVSRWKSDPTGLIKNLPTQTGGGGKKPNNQLNEKLSIPNGKWGRKTGKDQAEERSKTFLLAWWW